MAIIQIVSSLFGSGRLVVSDHRPQNTQWTDREKARKAVFISRENSNFWLTDLCLEITAEIE